MTSGYSVNKKEESVAARVTQWNEGKSNHVGAREIVRNGERIQMRADNQRE